MRVLSFNNKKYKKYYGIRVLVGKQLNNLKNLGACAFLIFNNKKYKKYNIIIFNCLCCLSLLLIKSMRMITED